MRIVFGASFVGPGRLEKLYARCVRLMVCVRFSSPYYAAKLRFRYRSVGLMKEWVGMENTHTHKKSCAAKMVPTQAKVAYFNHRRSGDAKRGRALVRCALCRIGSLLPFAPSPFRHRLPLPVPAKKGLNAISRWRKIVQKVPVSTPAAWMVLMALEQD